MPGYYDWKIRNCTLGARDKAASLLETMEAVDSTLHAAWDENGGSFPEPMDALLADVVAKIDRAEDALEKARLQLATLFPGHP
jgi:hypothetical protein